MYFYLLIIFLTIAGVAVGRIPVFRMNRATISLIGAAILIGSKAIALEEAYRALDGNTLVLLFSMMVINSNLRLSGFFDMLTARITHIARTPKQLLSLIIVSSGFLSALFLNDTIVLIFTPLVISVVKRLKLNHLPFLIGLMTSANIGSVATLTGNPQNMIIGMSSGITYLDFLLHMIPCAVSGMVIIYLVICSIYKDDLKKSLFLNIEIKKYRIIKPLFIKSVIAVILMVAGFLAGFPVPTAALCASALLLFTRRVKPEKVLKEVDFTLIVFFSGLFITTGALETTGLSDSFFSLLRPFAERGNTALAAVSLLLSNIISNVPAVLLFRPYIKLFESPYTSWLVLSLSTTFAGNLTLLGSVANLIVAESAKKSGIHISFREYLKSGIPITLLSVSVGLLFLLL